MFVIKWIELDDVFNYHPATAFAKTLEQAIEKQNEIAALDESQIDRSDELFSGKIMSEVIIEEIRLKE